MNMMLVVRYKYKIGVNDLREKIALNLLQSQCGKSWMEWLFFNFFNLKRF